MAPRIVSYAEFWPYYLREHARAPTRALHYLGTTLVLICGIAVIATGALWLLGVMIIVGYAPAWFGHVAIQKNRPATFRYPLWSLISDFRMYGDWITGRLGTELDKAGVDT